MKALKEAGFNDGQAEAVVETVGDAVGGSVATKTDTANLNADTKTVIAEVKGELTLVEWMLAVNLAISPALLIRTFFV